jgi:hypothetical protein
MYGLTEIDPVAAIRAEMRRALSRPLPIRLWHAVMRAWREVYNA